MTIPLESSPASRFSPSRWSPWRVGGIGLVVACALIAAAVFVRRELRHPNGPVMIRPVEISAVYAKLEKEGKDGSFGAFVFFADGQPTADHAVNLQFSNEHGKIGLDWVLRAAINRRDQARFRAFAGRFGYKVTDRELNGVRYLRVEDGDLQALCGMVIETLYHVPARQQIGLFFRGFTWP